MSHARAALLVTGALAALPAAAQTVSVVSPSGRVHATVGLDDAGVPR